MGTTILSTGHYTPLRRVTNRELETQLGLESGFILSRTGIRERRYAAPEETLTGMATSAGKMALTRVGVNRSQIGLLILATSTPDHLLPPSAALVAHNLGLDTAGAFDLAGACCGFLYALLMADAYAKAQNKLVLIIAANILSRRVNPHDRRTVILFSDAAGAVILAPDKRKKSGIRAAELASDGAHYSLIKINSGGSSHPFNPNDPIDKTFMNIEDGRLVFSRTVRLMTSSSRNVLSSLGVKPSEIRFCIPHQANTRIIKAVQKNVGFEKSQILNSITEFGNSSAATIPLTLSIHASSEEFLPGDKLLFCAAGAGLTGGAIIYEI